MSSDFLFSLIWCDLDIESVYGTRMTQEKLLGVIHFRRTFKSIEECEQYIFKKTTPADRIILISSGSFGQDLMRGLVHQLPQVNSVYIYCLLWENYQTLLTKFSKVHGRVIYS